MDVLKITLMYLFPKRVQRVWNAGQVSHLLFPDSTVWFFTLEWKNTLCVCVCICTSKDTHTHTHIDWFILFYDCPDSRVQSCAESPRTCRSLHAYTHNYFFPSQFSHYHRTDSIASIFLRRRTRAAHNFFLTHQVPHCTHKAHTHQMKCWCYKKTAVFNLSLKLNRLPTRTQPILHAVQVMFRTDSAVCLLYLICMQCGVKVPARWTKSPLGH